MDNRVIINPFQSLHHLQSYKLSTKFYNFFFLIPEDGLIKDRKFENKRLKCYLLTENQRYIVNNNINITSNRHTLA